MPQIANYGMAGQYYAHLDPHGYYQNDSSIRPDARIPYFEVGAFSCPRIYIFVKLIFSNRSEETASLHSWCISPTLPPEATPCFRSQASPLVQREALQYFG